jgi:thiol:disulfide interchange protein DsbC
LSKDTLSKLFKVGNGPVEVVEFTDPECSYCREVEQELEPVKDKFTRHVALMPFPSSQNSKALVEYILCNGTEEAYKDVFAGKVDLSKFECPAEKKKEVESVIENHLNLSKELGIKGTPTFIVKTPKGYKMVYGSSLELLDIIESEYK